MNRNGQTISNTLKEQHIMPRILSNLRVALSGKSNALDNEYVTSLMFNTINSQNFLMALYRDDTLRMWSMASSHIVCSINCMRDGDDIRSQGPQTNALRKIDDSQLCAFICHSMGSEFVIIKISHDGNSSYSMVRTKVISALQSDLSDFVVSESKIWALWCNAQGDFNVSNFCLLPGTSVNWISAAMEPPPDRFCVAIEQGMDPRQAYCSYIFHPGRFDKSVILKALVMFCRSNVLLDGNPPLSILKDRVCQAVENEIQNDIKDFDISDDEYIDICMRFWERFYSCCEQYHVKFCQPIGLVLLDAINAVCVVKKNAFSLLRPCEVLENLFLSGEHLYFESTGSTYFCENGKNTEDQKSLVALLTKLEKWLPDDIKLDIDKKLYQLEMPDIIASKLVADMFLSEQSKETFPYNFMVEIRQSLQGINNLCGAMAMLLETLRMSHSNEELEAHKDLSEKSRFFLSTGNLFGSNVGISILSESVRQIAIIRYSLCRNLLILQQILIDTFSVSCNILETIRSQLIPETVVFVQSYYVMVWISETPLIVNQKTSLESSLQRLNRLQLTENPPSVSSIHCTSILRVFLNSKGLQTALFYQRHFKSKEQLQWQFTLIPIAMTVSQIIWPLTGHFVFGEWLFENCQHLVIQEYVRLLNSWCEWNNCSRQFILAVSFLESGESHKAYDLFVQSAKGVLSEHFINEKILKSEGSLTASEALARYYLKVIQLFEQHNALDHIISTAQSAVGILDKDDPQLPMFQSIIFNNHLLLKHYEEAYHSLIYNADASRREDCLRQLVVSLFNKKRLDILMHFPYVGLQDEFEKIVESRARSLGVDENEHYNFLYAFHIAKGNMRKASSIMYEQAMRFYFENTSLEGMQKRYHCLLVCINCLHLIDERYQWIAKPTVDDATSLDMNMDATKEKVVVLEIRDIEKELLETEAYICLATHRRDIGSLVNTGVQELSVILANSGLYTAAIKLAKGQNVKLSPIFESLTAACIHTQYDENESWSWLQENDLADLSHKNSGADMAWLLLQKLIQEHEDHNATSIRKCVVKKILNLNAFIPEWLYSSYKADNASELLRLLVLHSRLLEAKELATEYIWALLGLGFEYFNLKNPIAPTTPPMCIPITTIDNLLYGLKANSNDVQYKQALTELEELVQNYIETSMRVSKDRIQYCSQVSLKQNNL